MKINYKQKFSPWLTALCILAAVLCAYAAISSAINLFRLTIVSEKVSAGFFALLNIVILVTVLFYLLRSGYSLKESHILIRTAYFSDRLVISNIKKIHFFVTEEELYLETDLSDNYVKINIKSGEINEFVKCLRQKLPNTPYEISLKMETEE